MPGATLTRKHLIDLVPLPIDQHPNIIVGPTGHLFIEGDPLPVCERCKRRSSAVIVAGPDPKGIGALATGVYLCTPCWGRIPTRKDQKPWGAVR